MENNQQYIDNINAAKAGELGDNGMGFDESRDQEDYATYSNYLSMIEDAGFSQAETLELMNLTPEDVDRFIVKFEPAEEE